MTYFFFFYRLDYNHQVKVSDFGLAEDVYTFRYFQQDANSDFKLPLKWMALESLQLGRFSEKTDVVSFFLQFFDHLYQCSCFIHIVVIWDNLLGNIQWR